MSALPPKADIAERDYDIRYVPNAEVYAIYSITSSARSNNDVATSTPMVFAVLKFTMV
jgi:hypothetical protein